MRSRCERACLEREGDGRGELHYMLPLLDRYQTSLFPSLPLSSPALRILNLDPDSYISRPRPTHHMSYLLPYLIAPTSNALRPHPLHHSTLFVRHRQIRMYHGPCSSTTLALPQYDCDHVAPHSTPRVNENLSVPFFYSSVLAGSHPVFSCSSSSEFLRG